MTEGLNIVIADESYAQMQDHDLDGVCDSTVMAAWKTWVMEACRGETSFLLMAQINGVNVGHVRVTPAGVGGAKPTIKDDTLVKIASFHVSSKWRGQGIGTKLMEAAVEMSRKLPGVEAVVSEVSRGNRDSVRTFKAAGFKSVPSRTVGLRIQF